ncbi:pirin family protein [Bdellovibrio sp. 22V]|uniref:pirin family protein n=1 Tax=Bdellovibrio TaxID=958 RepID=UPI0025430CB2|nr:pirin family protein [Bdellovibrio sp. 22V]WII72617.1 pirin family protein [Bdellovibrio sp. 22V]
MSHKNSSPRRKFLVGALTTTLGFVAAAAFGFKRKEKGMLTIRRSNERGLAEHGWLKSRHTFSFAEYYDPQHMGFGPLRVINEDRIAGGSGFETHPHRDMEIISYVISGGLRHRDSMGNVAVIKPGEVQRMSAGTGVLHSEFNDEDNKETHFFQIWIMPNQRGVKPGYGQKSFEQELNSQKLVHVISKDGKDGSISIHQDADMYISRLKKSETLDFKLEAPRRLWLQLVKGSVEVNGEKLETGDAVAATDIGTAKIVANDDSEMILFELP